MRAVIVKLTAGIDLIAELRRIDNWCRDQTCEPTSFEYHMNGGEIIVVAEFPRNEAADLFREYFHGLESEFVNSEPREFPETMATACRWRLRAEEIRAEYDGFSSPSARETMAQIARCYDGMATHLESRLAKEGGCLPSPGDRRNRFLFR